MEADQLPGYTGNERTVSNTLCDCVIFLCCMFILIGFLFLSAWDALVEEIPSDQFTQTIFPILLPLA